MRLPGAQFLADRRAVREFEEQDASWRTLVFYSEGSSDWPHLGPIVERLVNQHDRRVSYLTSEDRDPGLAMDHPQLRSFNIGAGTARTVAFARLDCQSLVLTLPDLGNLWLKRSVHPVHYVYAFHSMNSTHTSYRHSAFDHYDTILCVGPHHIAELRAAEATYQLAPRRLVEHGSTKLDTIMREVTARAESRDARSDVRVLVAPTWGESSLIERPEGRSLITALLDAGISTVLRLHPMTSRRMPNLANTLVDAFGRNQLFAVEQDMSATTSWLRADLMISDWSGAAVEYAFSLGRPVLYVDTPQKLMNARSGELGLPAFEERIRSQIGRIISPDDVADAPALVHGLLGAGGRAFDIAGPSAAAVFNVGRSVDAAADALLALDREIG